MQPIELIAICVNFSHGQYLSKELMHAWPINGYSVRLFKCGQNLSYETYEHSANRACVISQMPYEGSMEKIISWLKTRHPVFNKNGTVDFCRVVHSWQCEQSIARLIVKNEKLVWNIFRQGLEVLQPFSETTIPSEICHKSTVPTLLSLQGEALQRTLIEDFTIVKISSKEEIDKEFKETMKFKKEFCRKTFTIDMKERQLVGWSSIFAGWQISSSIFAPLAAFSIAPILTGAGAIAMGTGLMYAYYGGVCSSNCDVDAVIERCKQPKLLDGFCVQIEPIISEKSYIEPRIFVSKFTWAVTVLVGPKSVHASLLIEGISKQDFPLSVSKETHFLFRAHLVPPVTAKFIELERYQKWEKEGLQRTEIWMISSDKVSIMIEQIIKERDEQQQLLQKGKTVDWTPFGKYSFYGRGVHNCMTWIQEKLEGIYIPIPKTLYSRYLTMPTFYAHPLSYFDKLPTTVQI